MELQQLSLAANGNSKERGWVMPFNGFQEPNTDFVQFTQSENVAGIELKVSYEVADELFHDKKLMAFLVNSHKDGGCALNIKQVIKPEGLFLSIETTHKFPHVRLATLLEAVMTYLAHPKSELAAKLVGIREEHKEKVASFSLPPRIVNQGEKFNLKLKHAVPSEQPAFRDGPKISGRGG